MMQTQLRLIWSKQSWVILTKYMWFLNSCSSKKKTRHQYHPSECMKWSNVYLQCNVSIWRTRSCKCRDIFWDFIFRYTDEWGNRLWIDLFLMFCFCTWWSLDGVLESNIQVQVQVQDLFVTYMIIQRVYNQQWNVSQVRSMDSAIL